MIIHDLAQGSPEWLEFRRSHITASNISAIMGRSPFATKLDVYEEMILGKTKPFNRAMTRGTEMEPLAREWVEFELDLQLLPIVASHDRVKWAAASLDGIDLTTNTVVEIKCPGKDTILMAIGGRIPEQYMMQMQWQIFVTQEDKDYGKKPVKALYVCFDGERGIVIPVNRDQVMIDHMLLAAQDFWDNHILKLEAPHPTDKDFTINNSEEWALEEQDLEPWISKRREIKELLDQCDYEIEVRKTRLEQLAGGCPRMKGQLVKFTQFMRKGPVEYRKIPELIKVDLEKYRKAPSIITSVASISNDK